MTTCTRARALLFLQRSTFLITVNLIIIGGNGIRNQKFLDTCIVQAERNVTIKKTMHNNKKLVPRASRDAKRCTRTKKHC